MNVLGTVVILYILLGLELATGSAFGPNVVMPCFLLPGIVMIAMFAPPSQARWTGFLAGLALDLLTERNGVALVGPHALAGLLCASFVVTIRGMMIRRSALAWIFLAVAATLLAQLALVSLVTIRSWFEPAIIWNVWQELGQRVLASAYTAPIGGALWALRGWLMALAGLSDKPLRSSSRW
jgi:hypothetical protein